MTTSQRLADARNLVAALDHNLASALDYISGRKPSRAQDHPGDLGDNLANVYGIAGDLADILSDPLDIGHRLKLARARARDLHSALATAKPVRPGIAEPLEFARTHARDLDRVLARAQTLVHELEIGSRPSMPLARRLLAVAAWLLPAAEQARYAEEFRYELWEIAHVGGHRSAQLAYAARQVTAARRLRAELRVPRQRGAAGLGRGDDGAQACRQGRGRGAAGGAGGRAGAARTRRPGPAYRRRGRSGLLGDPQRGPDGPGQPGTARLAGQRQLHSPRRRHLADLAPGAPPDTPAPLTRDAAAFRAYAPRTAFATSHLLQSAPTSGTRGRL